MASNRQGNNINQTSNNNSSIESTLGYLTSAVRDMIDVIQNNTGFTGNNSMMYRRSYTGSSVEDLARSEEYVKQTEKILNRYKTAFKGFGQIFKDSNAVLDDLRREKIIFEESQNKLKNTKKELEDIKRLTEELANDLSEEQIKTAKEVAKGMDEGSKEAEELFETLTDGQQKYINGLRETRKEEINYNGEKERSLNAEISLRKAKISAITGGVKQITSSITRAAQEVNRFANSWSKADMAASKYAKSIGASGYAMQNFRKNAIDLVSQKGLGYKYGASAEDVIQMQNSYASAVGRNIAMTGNDIEGMAAMSAVMGKEQAVDFASKLERFGVSMEETSRRTGRMFADAAKSGISFDKYSKNFTDNLSMAQKLTFKNGLKGLQDMAKKSAEIRLDMQQIAGFADKLAEGGIAASVETGAQLQVLGGPFAQFSNPLQMLNEGLNDVGGLMDRFSNMTRSLGFYNSKTGEFEVSTFDKMRLRQASKAMGLDYGQVMESVNTTARRNFVEKQLANVNLSDADKELLMNTATVKEGRAVATWFDKNGNRREKNISELLPGDIRELKNSTTVESDNIKDIATILRGWDDYMTGFQKQRDNAKAGVMETLKIGRGIENMVSKLSSMELLLQMMAYGGLGMIGARAIGGIVGGGRMTAAGIGTKVGGTTTVPTQPTSEWMYAGKTTNGNPYRINRITKQTQVLNKKGAWINNSQIKVSQEVLDKVAKANATEAASVAKAAKLARAAKFANAAKVGVASGIMSGIITGVEEFGGYNNHSTARKIGSTGGSAAGGFIGSALGTLIPIPVVGSMLGGMVGAAIGRWAGSGFADDRGRNRLKNDFGLTEMAGDYRKKELRQINDAVSSGNIDMLSDRLKEKIKRNGDMDVLASKMDEFKNNTYSVNVVSVNGRTPGKRLTAATGMIVPGTSTTGDRVPVMVNSGEMILNKSQQANLWSAANGIQPRPIDIQKVLPNVRPNVPQRVEHKLSDLKISIDVNGNGIGGREAADMLGESLKKNPILLQNLSNMIAKQMNINERGNNVVEKFGLV